jgi:hypothetical protein
MEANVGPSRVGALADERMQLASTAAQQSDFGNRSMESLMTFG